MDSSLEPWLIEFKRKLDDFDARMDRRWAALEQRGAAAVERADATPPIVADNWGGLFNEIPTPGTVSPDSAFPPVMKAQQEAVVVADNWGGWIEQPVHDYADVVFTGIASPAIREMEIKEFPLQIQEREEELGVVAKDEKVVVVSALDRDSLLQGGLSAPRLLWRAPLLPPRLRRPRRAPPRPPQLPRPRRHPALRRPRRAPPRPPRQQRTRRAPLRALRLRRPLRAPPRPPWLCCPRSPPRAPPRRPAPSTCCFLGESAPCASKKLSAEACKLVFLSRLPFANAFLKDAESCWYTPTSFSTQVLGMNDYRNNRFLQPANLIFSNAAATAHFADSALSVVNAAKYVHVQTYATLRQVSVELLRLKLATPPPGIAKATDVVLSAMEVARDIKFPGSTRAPRISDPTSATVLFERFSCCTDVALMPAEMTLWYSWGLGEMKAMFCVSYMDARVNAVVLFLKLGLIATEGDITFYNILSKLCGKSCNTRHARPRPRPDPPDAAVLRALRVRVDMLLIAWDALAAQATKERFANTCKLVLARRLLLFLDFANQFAMGESAERIFLEFEGAQNFAILSVRAGVRSLFLLPRGSASASMMLEHALVALVVVPVSFVFATAGERSVNNFGIAISGVVPMLVALSEALVPFAPLLEAHLGQAAIPDDPGDPPPTLLSRCSTRGGEHVPGEMKVVRVCIKPVKFDTGGRSTGGRDPELGTAHVVTGVQLHVSSHNANNVLCMRFQYTELHSGAVVHLFVKLDASVPLRVHLVLGCVVETELPGTLLLAEEKMDSTCCFYYKALLPVLASLAMEGNAFRLGVITCTCLLFLMELQAVRWTPVVYTGFVEDTVRLVKLPPDAALNKMEDFMFEPGNLSSASSRRCLYVSCSNLVCFYVASGKFLLGDSYKHSGGVVAVLIAVAA